MRHKHPTSAVQSGPTVGPLVIYVLGLLLPAVTVGFHSAAHWLAEGRERARQRRALARLDDRLLNDIGVSRAEARHEARKLFWQG